jgi:hypothetical protein
MENYYSRKVWLVNATEFDMAESEHMNKTEHILWLEKQINDLTCQLDLAMKKITTTQTPNPIQP